MIMTQKQRMLAELPYKVCGGNMIFLLLSDGNNIGGSGDNPWGFILFGAIFIVLGIWLKHKWSTKQNHLRSNGVETYATITSVQKSATGKSGYAVSRIYILYEFGGNEYRTQLDQLVGKGVGEKVKLYVNPSNPADFVSDGNDAKKGATILIIVGIIAVILGIILTAM
jgi:hypothetical protein